MRVRDFPNMHCRVLTPGFGFDSSQQSRLTLFFSPAKKRCPFVVDAHAVRVAETGSTAAQLPRSQREEEGVY